MAACGAEQEMLRQVVAAADLIAADQVGIVGFQFHRCDDALAEDFRAGAGGVVLKDIQRAVGKGVCGLVPNRSP